MIARVIAGLVPRFAKQRVEQYVTAIVQHVLNRPLSSDTEVLVQQLLTILRHEHGVVLPPPKHLQVRVVGGYVPNFLESGFGVYHDLNGALKAAGKELKDFPRILDFGCGCGRVIRALRTLLPSAELYGMDIDGEAIEWLTVHYARIAKFVVAPHKPPTPLEDNQFDFVYGISVLTHLPEDMQFLWLEELRRITKPRSYLVLTTHGEKHYRTLSADSQRIMETKGFFYSVPGIYNYGRSISLPDFYQNAYHTHEYIRREWAKYFDVLDIQALRLENHQDTVLLQNSK